MFFVFLCCMVIENGNGNEVIGLRILFVYVVFEKYFYISLFIRIEFRFLLGCYIIFKYVWKEIK